MKKAFVGLLVVFLFSHTYCQDKKEHSEEEKERIEAWQKTYKTGMRTLAGWSIINIGTGLYGNFHYEGETKYFHQMNALWSTVNLSLSTAGLLRKTRFESTEKQIAFSKKLENTLAINTYLDLGYIVAGGLMVGLPSETNTQLRGYGKSIIIQGVFLFVFDEVFKIALRNQRESIPTKKTSFNLKVAPGNICLSF